MEMKNIEDKIERESFNFKIEKLMDEKISRMKERFPEKMVEKARRDYNLILDYFGVKGSELSSKELAEKYSITKSRVNQLVNHYSKIFLYRNKLGQLEESYFKRGKRRLE